MSVPPGVLGWAQVPEAGVESPPVVEHLDDVEDRGLELIAGRPGRPVEQTGLQRGVPGFDDGALFGTSFSKITVSRLMGGSDTDRNAWRERRLENAYPCLIVDARSEYIRAHGRVVSQGVLVVKGVREDGLRELLAVDVADTQSEATDDALFRRLKNRGLTWVGLVTSDDHRGLVKAIQRWPDGLSQRLDPPPLDAQREVRSP